MISSQENPLPLQNLTSKISELWNDKEVAGKSFLEFKTAFYITSFDYICSATLKWMNNLQMDKGRILP